MITTPLAFGSIALILGLYLIAIKPSWISVAMYGVMAASILLTGITSMGLPIPIRWAAMLGEMPARPKIAGFVLQEKKAIVILLTTGLSVSLEWSEKTAAELHDQAASAASSGQALAMEVNPGQGDAKRKGTGKKGFGFNPFGANSYGF